MKTIRFFARSFSFFYALNWVHASTLDIVPDGSLIMNSVVIENQAPQARSGLSSRRINLNTSCYGSNLRHTSYPLSPYNYVVADIVLADMPNNPARIILPPGYAAGSSTMIDAPAQTLATVDSLGNFNVNIPATSVQSITFHQQNIAPSPTSSLLWSPPVVVCNQCTNAWGYEYSAISIPAGPITASMNFQVSPSGDLVTINAAFPGQNGYCGGYYSPLMVFFDDKRPNFTGVTQFPLNKSGLFSYWPEANAAGYILAYDRDNEGVIHRADQLFGNNDKENNGFKELAKYDFNRDQVIDAKDPIFKKLLFWKPKDGAASAKVSTMKRAHDLGIEKIHLKYDASTTIPYGERAELRETAAIEFRKKNETKLRLGKVIDVWFGPARDLPGAAPRLVQQ